LVEEWFNRNGYFTIRGIKDKIEELDILTIKNLGANGSDCVHCEVQVGIRPVTYICKLTNEFVGELGVRSSNSAKLRTENQIKICAIQWCDRLKELTQFLLDELQHFFPDKNFLFLWKGVYDSIKQSCNHCMPLQYRYSRKCINTNIYARLGRCA
jgi:hypothetical protein